MPPVHGDGPPGGPPGGNSGGFMGGSSSTTATPTATTATPASTTPTPSTATPSPSSSSHNTTSTTTSPTITTATPTTATPTLSSSSTTSSSATTSTGSTASPTAVSSTTKASSSGSDSSSANAVTTESSSRTSSKSWEVPVIIGGAVAIVAVTVVFVYMRSAKRHRDAKHVSTPPPLRAALGGGGGYRQQNTMRATYDGLPLSPSSRSHPGVPATALLQEGRPRKGSKQPLKQPTIANRPPLTPSSEIATVTEPSLIHQAKYTISGEHYEGDSVVDTSRDARVTGVSEWSTYSQEEFMGQHNPPPSFYANLDPRESEYSPVYSTFSRDTGSEYGMSARFDSEIMPVHESSAEVSNRQTGAEFHDSEHNPRRIHAELKAEQRFRVREFDF